MQKIFDIEDGRRKKTHSGQKEVESIKTWLAKEVGSLKLKKDKKLKSMFRNFNPDKKDLVILKKSSWPKDDWVNFSDTSYRFWHFLHFEKEIAKCLVV